MGEFEFIRWVRNQTSLPPRIAVGIGDDCAVLEAAGRPTLVTTDMLLDGSHFHLAEAGPFRVGRKALAVNLSDIAAMGGRATATFVSLGLPRRGAGRLAEDLFFGMKPLADVFDAPIVGGDTNTWDGPLVVSITVLGEPGPRGPIHRSGARPGDWLMVTGSLGGSILGKHFDFTPRLREVATLQEFVTPHALIDISDGLAADLGHIAEESGCGGVLFADRIPLSDAANQMDDDRTPLEHALADGEDFELLLAVDPRDGKRLLEAQPLENVGLSWVGVCVAEPGLWLEHDGRRTPLAPLGYKHPFEDA